MDLIAGAMVCPEVRLTQPLGEGGMGTLWVARHLTMGIDVAAKFVFMDLADTDPTILERFNREADTLRQLDSPHVVKLYLQGKTDDGTPYIVMELLRGETLVDRLERTGELPPAEVGRLLGQLAEGLDHFHQRKIVHRDLKAENIFLVGAGAQPLVKILDFGLAKPPGAPGDKKLTALGTMVGTPEFMSPEQIMSAKDVDHLADLWAMAVNAYMMLVAARPFEGEKLGEVLLAIRTAQFTPPSQLVAGLPPAIDGWFARAFDISHKNRFQSAAEAAAAWQQALLQPAGAVAAPAPPGGPTAAPAANAAEMPAMPAVPTAPAAPVAMPPPASALTPPQRPPAAAIAAVITLSLLGLLALLGLLRWLL